MYIFGFNFKIKIYGLTFGFNTKLGSFIINHDINLTGSKNMNTADKVALVYSMQNKTFNESLTLQIVDGAHLDTSSDLISHLETTLRTFEISSILTTFLNIKYYMEYLISNILYIYKKKIDINN